MSELKLFPTIGALDWREAIRRGKVESNAMRGQVALAVARLRLVRALRRRAKTS